MIEPIDRRRAGRAPSVVRVLASATLIAAAACGPATAPAAGPGASTAGSPSGSTGSPTVLSIGERCPDLQEAGGLTARTVTFPASDGTSLYGAIIGSGSAGVVLANDVPHPICQLVAPATILARHGYRVLLFDYRGHGASAASDAAGRLDLDVLGAVGELRHEGASRVVLMGSYGGVAACVVAATEASAYVDGLVGFSPAAERGQYIGGPFDPVGALRAAPRLRVPVLYVAALHDGFVPVPEARRLYAATGSSDKTFLVVDDLPSWYLLQYDDRAASAVFRFLAQHT